MRYDVYIPCDLLKPYIKYFAVTETKEETCYKVFPDTGIVVGFQYRGRLVHVGKGISSRLSPSGITGLLDTYRVFMNSQDIGSILIYFKEAGAVPFFKCPLHELFTQSLSLDNFMLRSDLLMLEERICAVFSDSERINIVEAFLISRMRHTPSDGLVASALATIHRTKGIIRMKELASSVCASQSVLEKRFRQVVGASPKKFASIVRFKHITSLYNKERSLTDMGYEAGFYDQSHFIKEFKNFTGETPEVFFAGKRE